MLILLDLFRLIDLFLRLDSIIQPDPLLPWNILCVKDFIKNGTMLKESVCAIECNSRRGGCTDVIMDLINLR